MRKSKMRRWISVFVLTVGLLVPVHLAWETSVSSAPVEEWREAADPDGLVFDDASFQDEVTRYLGIPYRWGGSSRRGMDCSGFVKHVYSRVFGVDLPHNSAGQYRLSFLKSIPRDELRSGDLVFFARGKRIQHVGIYLSGGRFIHAARRKGVVISRLDAPYYRARYAGSKRLEALDGEDGQGLLGMDGRVEVALDEGNRIHLGFSSLVDGLASPDSLAFDRPGPLPCFSSKGETPGSAFSLELGYSKALLSDAWNLRVSALLERSTASFLDGGPGTDWRGAALNEEGAAMTPSYRGGLKIASSVDLLGGLRFTPSLAYIGSDGRTDPYAASERIVGLETLMILPVNNLRLAMALNYVDVLASAPWGQELAGAGDSVNLSYALQFGVVRNLLQLSLLGRHSLAGSPEYGSAAASEGRPAYDMFFSFDFSY